MTECWHEQVLLVAGGYECAKCGYEMTELEAKGFALAMRLATAALAERDKEIEQLKKLVANPTQSDAFNYYLGRSDERQMRDAEIAKWKESCAALADTIKAKDAEIERFRAACTALANGNMERDAEIERLRSRCIEEAAACGKCMTEIERLRSLLNRCAAELDNVPELWAVDLYREIKSLKPAGGGKE